MRTRRREIESYAEKVVEEERFVDVQTGDWGLACHFPHQLYAVNGENRSL